MPTNYTTAQLVEALRYCVNAQRATSGEACRNCKAAALFGCDPVKACVLLNEVAANQIETMEAYIQHIKENALVLPCKIGDPIYWVVTRHEYPHKTKTKYIQHSQLYWHNLERVLKEYGKTVFTTKEAAAAAIEGVKTDG